MTRIVCNRCAHCGSSYSWQASGPGASDLNDDTWCQDCRAAINEALKVRPRLYEKRYRDVNELPETFRVPLDTLLGWERELYAKRKQADNLTSFMDTAQRIWPALVDMTTGEFQNCREIRGQGKYENIGFRVSTWRSRPEDYKIEVPMEWDLQRKQWTGDEWR